MVNGFVFKERLGIYFKTVSGESGSVDETASDVLKSEVQKIIQETPAKEIFNVDESGLFLKSIHDKRLTKEGIMQE